MQDWVEKMIHPELFKRLKFDHTSKFKSKSLLKNEIRKILWDLVILTDHLIPVSKSKSSSLFFLFY